MASAINYREGAFGKAMTALLTALDLPIDETSELEQPFYVSIDGFDLEFTDSEDETALMCSIFAGALSADPPIKAVQLRRLLKTNLGYAVNPHRVCATLDQGSGGEAGVTLAAALPYRRQDMDELMEMLGDLVQLAEAYGDILADSTEQPRPLANDIGEVAEAMIFRP